jgi:hypothetical protein
MPALLFFFLELAKAAKICYIDHTMSVYLFHFDESFQCSDMDPRAI